MLVLAACGAGAAPAETSGGKKDRCSDFELDVQKVWSAGIKAEVLGRGGEVEAKTLKSVATKLDQMSDDWVRLRTATCRDHFDRQLLSAEEYKKRVTCFDDRLDQQRKLVTMAKSNDTAAAEELAKKLGDTPDACK